MRRILLIGLVSILGLAGCSNGVSQAEHDQAIAELALTQQRLAEAERLTVDVSQRRSEIDERITHAFASIGLIRDPNRDAIDQLSDLLVAVHEDQARQQEELERLLDEGHPAGSIDETLSRTAAYFETAQNILAEAVAYPDSSSQVLVDLSELAIRTLDMEVQTVIDDLVVLLDTDPEAFQASAISGAMQILFWGEQAAKGMRAPGVHSGG